MPLDSCFGRQPDSLQSNRLQPMHRIAVIADTHDRFPESVAEAIYPADEIWHLGDVCRASTLEKIRLIGPPVTVVKGNNDFLQSWPMETTLRRAGRSFRLIHIPPRPARLGDDDFLLHGHTQIPCDEQVGSLRILNPGAVGKANQGAPPSYAWLEIDGTGAIAWRIVGI